MENEKRYTIGAGLFIQLTDIFDMLMSPEMLEHIKKLDILTAQDIKSAYLQIQNIKMQRYLNNMMRKAYLSGNMDAVDIFRKTKQKMETEYADVKGDA